MSVRQVGTSGANATAACDVIVVGAGPAGSSTAFALAKAGISVTLIDRARFPRDKACAEYLSPQASRILASMGVLETVERAGAAQLTGMRIRAPDGTTFTGNFLASHGYRGFRDRGLAIPRRDLDTLLLNAARDAGVTVCEGWRLRDVAQEPAGRVIGVIGTDDEGRPSVVRARIVVAADGLHSLIARRLHLRHRARFPERYAVVAHYEGVEGIGTDGEMHVEADGYVGLADVGAGRTNVALVVPAKRMATARHGAADFLAEWIASHPHLAARFREAKRVSEAQAAGPFATRARRPWAPGVALVGDAAEYFDPFTGEGIYTALRGGELLAPFVARAARSASCEGADRALADYAMAHAREFRGKRIVERMIGAAVAYPWIMNRAARVLHRRREMADLLVGVVGDFVPASEVLQPKFLINLMRPAPR